eukprot:scaffold65620_cov13-Tisochrysis_lutea.AAC.1
MPTERGKSRKNGLAELERSFTSAVNACLPFAKLLNNFAEDLDDLRRLWRIIPAPAAPKPAPKASGSSPEKGPSSPAPST